MLGPSVPRLTVRRTVQSLSALQTMAFANNPLGKTGVRALASALNKSQAPLEQLHLATATSPNGGSLGDALTAFTEKASDALLASLRVLDLSENLLGTDDLAHKLAPWLANMQVLEVRHRERNGHTRSVGVWA